MSIVILKSFSTRNHCHAVFDFSGKRVRKNGKFLTKSDLSYEIGRLSSCDPFAIYSCFLYREYADRLKFLLCYDNC